MDEKRLTALVRASCGSAGLAMRARIVLLAAQGLANAEILLEGRCGTAGFGELEAPTASFSLYRFAADRLPDMPR